MIGFAVAAAKGYIQQEVNTYDGALMDAARLGNEVTSFPCSVTKRPMDFLEVGSQN